MALPLIVPAITAVARPLLGRALLRGISAANAARLAQASARYARPVRLSRPSLLSIARRLYRQAQERILPETGYIRLASGDAWQDLGDWYVYGECGSPNGLYSGDWGRIGQSVNVESGGLKTSADNCVVLQPIQAGSLGDPFNVGDTIRSICIGRKHVTLNRAQGQLSFTRPDQGPFEKPWYGPYTPRWYPTPQHGPGLYIPDAAPMFFPGDQPIPHYHMFPVPLAYPMLTPLRRVVQGLWQMKEYETFPVLELPSHTASPMFNSTAVPCTVIEYRVGQRKPRVRGGTHFRRPPGKNEKEKKFQTGARGLRKFISFATEGVDFVNVLYKSIPDKYKPKYTDKYGRITSYALKSPSFEDKLQIVYHNLDHVDSYTFMLEYAKTQAGDTFAAKLNKQVSQTPLPGGSSVGVLARLHTPLNQGPASERLKSHDGRNSGWY